MSLQRILKDHQQRQASLKELNDKKKRVAMESMAIVSRSLVANVNSGVSEIFANQQALEAEAKALQQHAARFAKQTQNWIVLFDQLNTALKELGDVENWSKMIENDVDVICNALEFTANATQSKQQSPTTPPHLQQHKDNNNNTASGATTPPNK
eukprot:GEZU01031402.1.p1 GENE.GEZU01031402.1~~GEZU01031402.1.p1  ORF type:complete len:154 (+),score=46.44 GEZU01031402.1:102-563(+)